MKTIYLIIPLVCLAASLIVGLAGKTIGRIGSHTATIGAVAVAFGLSVFVAIEVAAGARFDESIYIWAVSDGIKFEIGFLIDELSAVMMVVVTFVSLMVHIYTVGYMREDPGYARFFSYISLFTFAMLILVMSNNFLQLFFGWEAVGLVSYLLIGFWFERESATFANLKAFLVNRVGDLGFLLGIAAILYVFGTLDYAAVFASAPQHVDRTVIGILGNQWSWLTVICLLLFIGAMGKSAQVPLHVWLPDSMEGPTPISALIHAATMVTAGIFMVARMSPLFELSQTALTVVVVIGAVTAFSMALIALVQNDIKRVVAYSTLSQLGYMTVALGVSAYSVAILHLTTHAFFKALLFLCAGSVIVALHHEQDMRRMGALWKRMPITYLSALVGSVALVGIPPFSGFFSKDAIIQAVSASHLPVTTFAYVIVLAGVFITALYSFRLIFMVFHGKSNLSDENRKGVRESPRVITVPLILLGVPSVLAGIVLVGPTISGHLFGNSLVSNEGHGEITHGAVYMLTHAWGSMPIWLALAGIFAAWILYVRNPAFVHWIARSFRLIYLALFYKYGIDQLYERVFMIGSRALGGIFWKYGDRLIIDDGLVNGTARLVGRVSSIVRLLQTGYVYHYAFAIIIGLVVLMSWVFWL
jgi:NADH-quinone oxidoreductase subunit L